MNALFTVGHSSHSIEGLLQLLLQHQIQAVADVRSRPYSRHFPCFSKEPLELSLKSAGIHSVFLGRELGARRDERACYIENAVSYDLVAATPAFAKGLERLQEGLQNHRIALLCAEKDPLDCHRTILIARHAKRFAQVIHILADGSLETHQEAENRLLRRFEWSDEDLFRPHETRLAEAYARRGREIAWVESGTKESPL